MASKTRVLLTNDDGPPSKDSPFILGLYLALVKSGYDVKVVIPSSQKSWIGKAYQIKDKIYGRYYYPRERGEIKPETSDVSRPLKEGELGEWILLDGTPATCANIGLHNLYPDEIDLVISGPNFGRNTSSAFVLSSGTIGAAMSSSLAMVRSIALSYGVFVHPNPPEFVPHAHKLALRIINRLWGDWGSDPISPRKQEVELYNVNIPLVKELLLEGSLEVVWTRIWRNRYASLFQPTSSKAPVENMPAGPDGEKAPNTNGSESSVPGSPTRDAWAHRASTPLQASGTSSGTNAPSLTFHFAPQMSSLVNPPLDQLPYGSDAWAVHHAKASVTPLRTSFAEPGLDSFVSSYDTSEDRVGDPIGRPWKWKL